MTFIKQRCKCGGPATCKQHGGEFTFCDEPLCLCHKKPECTCQPLMEHDGKNITPLHAVDCPARQSEQPYNQHDHHHCWESENPPCGQKIEHLKCCLCELLNPEVECQKEASYEAGRESLKPLIGTFELKRLEARFDAGKREGLQRALVLAEKTRVFSLAQYVTNLSDALRAELSKLNE